MTYKPGTFFTITHKIIDSRRYKKLSCFARAAFIEFHRAYNGHNNGNLLMSSRMMAEKIGCSFKRASIAILELRGAQLIEVTCKDEYGKKPKARTYRLMEHKCDVTGMRAGQASSMPPKMKVPNG